jgi:hypothetical protein
MGNAGVARPINPQQAQGRHREGSFPPAGPLPDEAAQRGDQPLAGATPAWTFLGRF